MLQLSHPPWVSFLQTPLLSLCCADAPAWTTERDSLGNSLRLCVEYVESWLHHFLALRLALSKQVNNLCLTYLIWKMGVILITTIKLL